MPCSICRQNGHNRATCPNRRLVFTGLNNSSSSQITYDLAPPPVPRPPDTPPPPSPFHRTVIQRRRIVRRFKKSVLQIKYIRLFILNCERRKLKMTGWDNDDIIYFSWLKIKPLISQCSQQLLLYLITKISSHHSTMHRYSIDLMNHIQSEKAICSRLYGERNTVQEKISNESRSVTLLNLKKENFLIYWAVGNYMVQDLDSQENNVNYMGLLPKGGSFKLRTINGHRFYMIPHRLDIEPSFHPGTDKQFLIEPYLEINIHEGIIDKIYIDDKDKLSELNKWKFNALKLDYLIKEVIKLGGKNNDILECVLDLHEDIKLDEVTEMEKDMAGIPSNLTNIT